MITQVRNLSCKEGIKNPLPFFLTLDNGRILLKTWAAIEFTVVILSIAMYPFIGVWFTHFPTVTHWYISWVVIEHSNPP